VQGNLESVALIFYITHIGGYSRVTERPTHHHTREDTLPGQACSFMISLLFAIFAARAERTTFRLEGFEECRASLLGQASDQAMRSLNFILLPHRGNSVDSSLFCKTKAHRSSATFHVEDVYAPLSIDSRVVVDSPDKLHNARKNQVLPPSFNHVQ